MKQFWRDILIALVAGVILVPISYYWGHEATLSQAQNMKDSSGSTMQQSSGDDTMNISFVGGNYNKSPITFEKHTDMSSSTPLTATTILSRSDSPDLNGLYLTTLKIDILSEKKAKLNVQLPLFGFFTKCDQTASTSRSFNDANFPEIHAVLEMRYTCYSKVPVSPDNLIFWY